MKKSVIQIFCGEGKGKTSAAIGKAIQAAGEGKTVMIIQFLKGCQNEPLDYIQRLVPEIKIFRFERSESTYENLTEEEREKEMQNIRNGLNFAKKVISTQGCDMLVLDEVLGLPAAGIIEDREVQALMEEAGNSEMELILTGIHQDGACISMADEVTVMQRVK